MPERHSKPLNNVMLIEPQNGVYTGFQGLVRTEPLALEYIAGAISPLDPNKPRLVENVSIHDDRLQPGGWIEKMRREVPDMIGIKLGYTADVVIVRQLVRDIRKEVGKEIPIIIGGHHATVRPSDVFLDEVDAVVVGAGEDPIQDLSIGWKKDRSFSKARQVWYRDEENNWHSNVDPLNFSPYYEFNSSEMDNRPLPRRDLVKEYREMGDGYYFLYYPNAYSMETGRGCRGRCGFCTIPIVHGGKYTVQSPERTVAEMAALPSDAKYVIIVDDLSFASAMQLNPASGKRELYDPGLKIAELMKEQGLAKKLRFWSQIRADSVYPKDPNKRKLARKKFESLAEVGYDMALIGFESLINGVDLKSVNKGSDLETNLRASEILKGLGIRRWGAQIVFPNWTAEDYKKVIAANNALGIENPQYTIMTLMPGSPFYIEGVRNGILKTFNPAHFDFFHWVVETLLPEEETYRQITGLYQEAGGSLTSLEGTKRDLREKRTNTLAIRAFLKRFAVMQDPETHVANLRLVEGTNDIDWVQLLGQNAAKFGGIESVLLQVA